MGNLRTIEVSVRGKWVPKAALDIRGQQMVARGRFIRTAAVHDAEWLEHELEDAEAVIDEMKRSGARTLKADVFTFAQRIPNTTPKYSYLTEWDSIAAIRLENPTAWWESLPQEARKNVRRAGKRGVTVDVVEFNDDLVRGIQAINDETPVRQGRPFPHYGKDLAAVRRDYSSFLDRAKFIAAYFEGELIGLIQIIYLGKVASTLEILTKSSHYDKRPANALIAKAVEVCAADGLSYLVYGKYTYGNKGADNPLTEFKRRNGFEEFRVPRYYVPLTTLGWIGVACKLHRGVIGMLPQGLIGQLLSLRDMWYSSPFARKPV